MNAVQRVNKESSLPFSFRLPKEGVDPLFGGTRDFWNKRVLPSRNSGKPPVQSVLVREPGAKRGVRFIFVESAVKYFNRLAQQENIT